MLTVRGQKLTTVAKIFVCKSHHREKNVWRASSDTSNFVDRGAAQGCAAAVKRYRRVISHTCETIV